MKIGRFSYKNEVFTGIIEGNKVGSIGNIPIEKLISINIIEDAKNLINRWFLIDELEYEVLLTPGKIICLGLNYKSHAAEGGWQIPQEPVYFEKSSCCIIPHKAKICIPENTGRFDPEVELAVIIGKKCKRVRSQDAEMFIAGYTIGNDVTARNMQKMDQSRKYPWFRSKSMDTFFPAGPWMVTKDEIGVCESLNIQLRINGEVKQSSNTGNMIFTIPEIIEAITRYLTLYPGDIISTGTPEGISPIKDGDIVECEIEKIGVLSNTVIYDG